MKKLFILTSLVAMVLGLMAFQCSSTELTSAKMYINNNNYAKAKESLNKEIEKNPANEEALYLMGFIAGEEGEIETMIEFFDRASKAGKKFEEDIKQNRLYHWATSFNKGVAFYNRAAKVSDSDSTMNFIHLAAVQFKNSTLCEPDSFMSYENLSYAYISMGQNDKAVAPLKKLIELKGAAENYSMLGELYLNEGIENYNVFANSNNVQDSVTAFAFYNKSINILEKGREKYPEDGNILLLLSNAYINANKIDVAMDAFKAGVEQEPENKYYRYNYGVLLLNDLNYEEAEHQFKKAIEIDPEYTNAIYNLGVTYFRWGVKLRDEAEAQEIVSDEYKEKLEQALPYLEKFLETGEEDFALWELMGKIYANLGMSEKSAEAFDKADSLR
ncbi:tetratricopeptide repeat protein [Bacteroidota bacterium]